MIYHPCLSIRQPWAWLILYRGKDIENRMWPTSVRGRVYIHASKSWDEAGAEYIRQRHHILLPMSHEVYRGGLVGTVEIVDCVEWSDSRWFQGPYGFVLRDPEPVQFVTCPGKLKFFQVKI